MSEKYVRKTIAARIMVVIMVAMMIVVGAMPEVMAGSSKTKSMTKYDRVIVKGHIAYCCDGYNVFRVNLKTNKVKKLTKTMFSVHGMKYYKGYIYYEEWGGGTGNTIYRVKARGGGRKKLASQNGSDDYVITKSKIYYDTYGGWNSDKRHLKQMNLNGTGKQKSKIKIKNKSKDSNKSGYSVAVKESSNFDWWDDGKGYANSYLIKSNGKKVKLAHYTGKQLHKAYFKG